MRIVDNPSTLTRVGLGLAVATSAAYLLIAGQVLAAGRLDVAREGGAIVSVAAAAYFLGGLLILARRRWLLVLGAVINALVIAFYFNLYQARPDVLFSPAGLVSKAAQILLEVALLTLIVVGPGTLGAAHSIGASHVSHR